LLARDRERGAYRCANRAEGENPEDRRLDRNFDLAPVAQAVVEAIPQERDANP
jgi:hypothetical protein